jgi:23S rRNA pseudouridine2605 synthase
MMRLHKFLAACGCGSRRACETLMAAGRVRVDGAVVMEPGTQIDPAVVRVEVDGSRVRREPLRWIMLNKPPQYICSSSDPQGRPSFLDLLPSDFRERLYTVGRLDFMSEGLLLVTNDGDLANRLMHPRYGVHKWYRVCTVEKWTEAQLAAMRRGVRCEGELLTALQVRPRPGPGHPQYEVELGEGRNRHIRRMLAELGLHVVSLCRTQVGPLRLGGLASGAWRELTAAEVEKLRGAIKPQ